MTRTRKRASPVFYAPTGDEVRALRQSVNLSRARFAEELHIELCENIKTWETERRDVRMPAPLWHLARLTFDLLYRAKWLQKQSTRNL